MSDDDGFSLVEGSHETDDVADQVELRVGLDPGGRIGASVAALIRRNRVIARGCERGKLMLPRVPRLREAVAENHR